MVVKDFKIKQKTSNGYDVLHPETRAEQVIINQTTGATLDTHLDDNMHVHWIGNATGTNALVATYAPITAYKNGLGVAVNVVTNSTAASTLNINGLGVIPIKKENGNAKTLKVGVYTLRYVNGNFYLQGEGGEYGTAEVAQVLAGYTIGRETGIVNGTMVNRGNVGTQNLTAKGASYTVPQGYHDGNGKVTATYESTSDVRVENTISLPAASQVYLPHPWGSGNGVSPYNASTATVVMSGMVANYFETSIAFGTLYRPGSPYGNAGYISASNFNVTMDNTNIRFFSNSANTFRYLITRMPKEWM